MAYNSDQYQVCIRQRHAGQDLCNVIAVEQTTTLTPLEVGQRVQNAWEAGSSFIDCQVQDVEYIQTEVFPLDGSAMTTIVPWDIGLNGAGNVVGDPVDPGSCLGFTLYTSAPGKSRRGRIYIGGVGRGGLDAFSVQWDLTTSPGSTFKDCAQEFYDDMATNNLIWAVNSRKLESLALIDTIVCRTSILSQNQRARRYGVV